jgi:uncharacterized protein
MVSDEYLINPEPPPPPEKRVWGGWATAGLGAAILFFYFVVQTVVALVGLVALWFSQNNVLSDVPYDSLSKRIMDVFWNNIGLLQSIATIVSGIAGVGLIILFIKARGRAGVAEYLGLRKPHARDILFVIPAVALYIGLSFGLDQGTGGGNGNGIIDQIYKTSVWPPLMWIAVIAFAPAFEEVMFRGFLFEGFRQSGVRAAGAILITALTWSLLHIVQYGIFTVTAIFILGIVMGIVRLATKSLWNTIIIHALVNTVGMLGLAGILDKAFR